MKVRQPVAAGHFYPADPDALTSMVSSFLEEAAAGPRAVHRALTPRAIVAPHAGYRYSGPIAASAYVHVARAAETIRRVLLIGPAHHVPLRGLAASSAEAFSTPLGPVTVDWEAVEELLPLPQVTIYDAAHEPEHGLEVHLPFLQVVLSEFLVVPLLVGDAVPEKVAEVLERVIDEASAETSAKGSDEGSTLIVVSSDLSHYQPYNRAVRLDHETSQQIERLQRLAAGQACGRNGINGLLQLARGSGWSAHTVDVRNSGDTGGPRHQVVGYGSYLFG